MKTIKFCKYIDYKTYIALKELAKYKEIAPITLYRIYVNKAFIYLYHNSKLSILCKIMILNVARDKLITVSHICDSNIQFNILSRYLGGSRQYWYSKKKQYNTDDLNLLLFKMIKKGDINIYG